MLSRRPHVDQTDARFASNIDAQVSRLTRLVDDLLDVTRFSRGEFELTLAPTDLRPVIEETVARFRIVAPRHTFVVRMNSEDFTGEWDRDRLEQVLSNLLSNAVKYSPEGGEITVSVSRDSGWVTIGVRDQGMGIDEEHQRSLFRTLLPRRGRANRYSGPGPRPVRHAAHRRRTQRRHHSHQHAWRGVGVHGAPAARSRRRQRGTLTRGRWDGRRDRDRSIWTSTRSWRERVSRAWHSTTSQAARVMG